MPTAAKLIAALTLAALGIAVSEVVKMQMPERNVFGLFTPVNAGLGALCGWFVVGRRAGRGMAIAVSNGLTGVVVLVFWALVAQAMYEMLHRALARRYDSPVEAFAAILEIMAGFAGVLATGPVLWLLFLGAVAAGLLAEAGARRWR